MNRTDLTSAGTPSRPDPAKDFFFPKNLPDVPAPLRSPLGSPPRQEKRQPQSGRRMAEPGVQVIARLRPVRSDPPSLTASSSDPWK
jgi:hypothetical protein